MYQNVEEYVRANGYEVSDLTKEELREAEKEMEMVNRGEDFVDGIFSGSIDIPLGNTKLLMFSILFSKYLSRFSYFFNCSSASFNHHHQLSIDKLLLILIHHHK